MNKEIYAFLQIQTSKLIFGVICYRDKTKTVIFSKTDESEIFLNENDEVINITHVRNIVSRWIANFEFEFKMKLERIGLILPIKTLVIKKSENFEKSYDGKQLYLNDEIYNLLIEKLKKDSFQNKLTIVKTKIMSWQIDENESSLDYPKDQYCNQIKLDGLNYSINKNVFDSHKSVINLLERDVLSYEFENQAKIFQVIPNEHLIYKKVIHIDWNKNNINLNCIINETIFEIYKIKGGYEIENIIENVAKQLNVKKRYAESYLYDLIDFEDYNDGETIYYRKKNKDLNSITEFSKNQLMEIFNTYFCKAIKAIDLKIRDFIDSREKFDHSINNFTNTKQLSFVIYISGEANKISGLNTLFAKYSEFKDLIRFYFPIVIGEILNPEQTTIIGAANSQKITNNSSSNMAFITSTKIASINNRLYVKTNNFEDKYEDTISVPTGFAYNREIDFSLKEKYGKLNDDYFNNQSNPTAIKVDDNFDFDAYANLKVLNNQSNNYFEDNYLNSNSGFNQFDNSKQLNNFSNFNQFNNQNIINPQSQQQNYFDPSNSSPQVVSNQNYNNSSLLNQNQAQIQFAYNQNLAQQNNITNPQSQQVFNNLTNNPQPPYFNSQITNSNYNHQNNNYNLNNNSNNINSNYFNSNIKKY